MFYLTVYTSGTRINLSWQSRDT